MATRIQKVVASSKEVGWWEHQLGRKWASFLCLIFHLGKWFLWEMQLSKIQWTTIQTWRILLCLNNDSGRKTSSQSVFIPLEVDWQNWNRLSVGIFASQCYTPVLTSCPTILTVGKGAIELGTQELPGLFLATRLLQPIPLIPTEYFSLLLTSPQVDKATLLEQFPPFCPYACTNVQLISPWGTIPT